jgi:hypothetical protein
MWGGLFIENCQFYKRLYQSLKNSKVIKSNYSLKSIKIFPDYFTPGGANSENFENTWGVKLIGLNRQIFESKKFSEKSKGSSFPPFSRGATPQHPLLGNTDAGYTWVRAINRVIS